MAGKHEKLEIFRARLYEWIEALKWVEANSDDLYKCDCGEPVAPEPSPNPAGQAE